MAELRGTEENARNIAKDEYYQQLQHQIKQKFNREDPSIQIEANESDGANDNDNPERVKPASKARESEEVDLLLKSTDEVRIGSTKWERDENGEFRLVSTVVPGMSTSVDLENNGRRILRLLGHKIDFSDRLTSLKEQFMQSVVQSRGSNYFLSKFAGFKVGMLGQLLSVLGVSVEEIQTMKTSAIKEAMEDNKRQMSETLYNLELTELVYGRGKKNKNTLSKFVEIQQQLETQMALLGDSGYWTKLRILEEKRTQLNRIREEFVRERRGLAYQYEFATQEIADREGILDRVKGRD